MSICRAYFVVRTQRLPYYVQELFHYVEKGYVSKDRMVCGIIHLSYH